MSDRTRPPRIQICRSSGLAGQPALVQRLRQAGAAIEVIGCLDQCTLCQHRAVALVSGWHVYGRTVEELCDKILEALQEVSATGRLS